MISSFEQCAFDSSAWIGPRMDVTDAWQAAREECDECDKCILHHQQQQQQLRTLPGKRKGQKHRWCCLHKSPAMWFSAIKGNCCRTADVLTAPGKFSRESPAGQQMASEPDADDAALFDFYFLFSETILSDFYSNESSRFFGIRGASIKNARAHFSRLREQKKNRIKNKKRKSFHCGSESFCNRTVARKTLPTKLSFSRKLVETP